MNEFKKIKNNNETRYVLETMTAGATGASAIATVEKDIGEVQKRIPDTSKPRNFVAKNAKMGGAGQHKDKKKAEKQGDVKHRKPFAEQGVAEGSGPKEKQKTPYRDINSPEYRAAADKQKQRMAKDKAAEPGKKMLAKQGVAEGVSDLSYDAQSLITKLRRDVEEKRLRPTPEAVLAAARELAGDMEFAPQLLVKQVLGQGVAEGGFPKKISQKEVDKFQKKHNDKLTGREVNRQEQEKKPADNNKKQGVAEGLQARLAELKNKVKEAYGRYDRRDAYQRDYDSSVSGMDRGNNHRDDERHDLDPSDWYIVKDGKMYKTSVYPRQEQEAIARGYSRSREEAKSKADSVAEGVDPYFESLRARVEELAKK